MLQSSWFKAAWILGSFLLVIICMIRFDDWASPGVEIALALGIVSFFVAIRYAGRKRSL